MEKVDISVNLCTYNRCEMLRDTLNSLLHQQTEGEFLYEIVIVDDGSTDETPLLVQDIIEHSCIPIRYFREERVGVAAARNRGIRESRGEWIAFIDDDETAEPNWLYVLKTTASANRADCVGGGLRLTILDGTDNSIAESVRKQFCETVPLGWFQRRFTYSGPGTGNVLVRSILFERIGLFDGSLTIVGEDQDFFRRARQAGCKIVFAPSALVHHFIPSSRLLPHHILGLAQRHGKSLAFFDCREWGFLKAGFICGLRIGHVILRGATIVPKYIVKHDRSSLFGLKCSIYTTVAYYKEMSSLVRKSVFGGTWRFLLRCHGLR